MDSEGCRQGFSVSVKVSPCEAVLWLGELVQPESGRAKRMKIKKYVCLV
jgi:hypothetical protein